MPIQVAMVNPLDMLDDLTNAAVRLTAAVEHLTVAVLALTEVRNDG